MRTYSAMLTIAATLLVGGCTDLKLLQAQVDELKTQVSQLRSDSSGMKATTAAAAADASAAKQAGQPQRSLRRTSPGGRAGEPVVLRRDQREARPDVQALRVEVAPEIPEPRGAPAARPAIRN